MIFLNILKSEFFSQYYNKFKWLYAFLAENYNTICQVILIVISFLIVAIIVFGKSIVAKAIKYKDSDARYKNPLYKNIASMYKEILLIISLSLSSFLLKYFQIQCNLIIFTAQFVFASLIARITAILSKNSIKYILIFNLLIVFIIIDSDTSPFNTDFFANLKIFLNISAKTLIHFIMSIICAFFIYKELEKISSDKIDVLISDKNLQFLAHKISKIVTVFILFLFVMKSLNIDMKIFSIFTGALGVGLGLGLQKFFTRMTSGVMIIIDQNMQIGDLVDIESTSGIVESISTKYLTIKGSSGQHITIPAEKVMSANITNHSKNKYGKIECYFYIDIESDVVIAIEQIQLAIFESNTVLENMINKPLISDVSTNGIVIKASFWIDDFVPNSALARHNFLKLALEKLAANNIKLHQNRICKHN
ncbi:mechanosensitive ion channel domain-containing protein [Candidatus Deianiraea vastatrix]|uniref:Small-conductance mechanosensitive channel n=1 Tax=Candidatus Deianiraea vastatrix TaxID=2163644 RepID=A0A5B8XDN6_9RICK|nr:mechanosensitive ion channel domain-containing protein [Candidatus Deianiraea vastatrix]QED23126.1 MscS-family mechanosensitive channel [Candidatus Deianiraea vastatrix]